MGTTLAVVQPQTQLARPETFAPRTLDEAMKFADLLIQSGMLPKSYAGKNAATIVVALQFGMELGMQPMQSLQNIANINGQPGVWGDAALALVLSSGLCEYYQEDDFETIKKNKKATFIVKRRGFPKEKVTIFSYEDAVTAKIFDNAVWKTYPARMCQMRARSFGLRDTFPDVLKGLPLAEELQDYGATIEGSPSQPTTATAKTTEKPKTEEVIGMAKATEFYNEYFFRGWTPAESKVFLKDKMGIVEPRTSKDIPASRLKEAMDWAGQDAPIRKEVLAIAESLGMTDAEKIEAWNKHSVLDGRKNLNAWTNWLEEAKAELDKRNSQEQ